MELTLRLDESGRLIVPPNVRRALGWNYGDLIAVTLKKNRLVFQPPRCFLCGSAEKLTPVAVNAICQSCLDEIGTVHEEST